MKRYTVIPVPGGMRVEDAWDEIQMFGQLLNGRRVTEEGIGGTWATIEEDIEDEDG